MRRRSALERIKRTSTACFVRERATPPCLVGPASSIVFKSLSRRLSPWRPGAQNGGILVHVVEYTRRASAAQLCSGCGASGRWAIGYCRGRRIRGNLAVVFGVGFAFEARAVSPRFSGVAAKAAWRASARSGHRRHCWCTSYCLLH